MDLEAGRAHEQRRLDLGEVALREQRAHLGERTRARVQRVHPSTRQPGDLAAWPGIIAAAVRADDRGRIDEVAGTPIGLRDHAGIAALAADDRHAGVGIDREDATAHYFEMRSTYSCVRVSILSKSPTRMNSGTMIIVPVSTVAGF